MYANVFISPSVKIQGLTSGEKKITVKFHTFFIPYLCSKVKQGGESHLQFSLPLGNNTWRTHLP